MIIERIQFAEVFSRCQGDPRDDEIEEVEDEVGDGKYEQPIRVVTPAPFVCSRLIVHHRKVNGGTIKVFRFFYALKCFCLFIKAL